MPRNIYQEPQLDIPFNLVVNHINIDTNKWMIPQVKE